MMNAISTAHTQLAGPQERSEQLIKVIVAEDNLVQRMYFVQLVQQLGFDALPAIDGEAALELIKETDAQILISDFKMPKLDGLELTRQVRSLAKEQYVHIIMITGTGEDDLRDEALRSGADDFIAKGSNLADLKARMRTARRLIEHATELADRTRILEDSNRRIQNDLDAAAEAQRNLLPDLDDDLLGFRVSSAFLPSSDVSGDMFGCFPISEDVLGLYAVDVAGHGVHAALLSVAIGHLITPEFFRTRVMHSKDQFDVADLVSNLNQRFSNDADDQYFSMFCAVIDQNRNTMTYCQAGYPSPLLVSVGDAARSIGQGGFPVGMFFEAEFENETFDFPKGSTLVICSDAASEAENKNQEQFGDARLKALVEETAGIPDLDLPDVVVDALSSWRQGLPLEDDLTVVALERS